MVIPKNVYFATEDDHPGINRERYGIPENHALVTSCAYLTIQRPGKRIERAIPIQILTQPMGLKK